MKSSNISSNCIRPTICKYVNVTNWFCKCINKRRRVIYLPNTWNKHCANYWIAIGLYENHWSTRQNITLKPTLKKLYNFFFFLLTPVFSFFCLLVCPLNSWCRPHVMWLIMCVTAFEFPLGTRGSCLDQGGVPTSAVAHSCLVQGSRTSESIRERVLPHRWLHRDVCGPQQVCREQNNTWTETDPSP